MIFHYKHCCCRCHRQFVVYVNERERNSSNFKIQTIHKIQIHNDTMMWWYSYIYLTMSCGWCCFFDHFIPKCDANHSMIMNWQCRSTHCLPLFALEHRRWKLNQKRFQISWQILWMREQFCEVFFIHICLLWLLALHLTALSGFIILLEFASTAHDYCVDFLLSKNVYKVCVSCGENFRELLNQKYFHFFLFWSQKVSLWDVWNKSKHFWQHPMYENYPLSIVTSCNTHTLFPLLSFLFTIFTIANSNMSLSVLFIQFLYEKKNSATWQTPIAAQHACHETIKW